MESGHTDIDKTYKIKRCSMEKIGKLLKERRLELGLTVEEVSEKTRLTQKHIKALEEGDISFFHDDLSYLRFFVKSYCEVLGLDFEDVKDELRENVNDYTMSFTTSAQMNHEEIEKHIANSEKLTKVNSADVRIKKRRKFRKPDMSLVSLIAIVAVVAIVIMFAFVVFLRSDTGKGAAPKDDQPIASVQNGTGDNKYPSSEEKEQQEEKEKEEEKKEISVTKTDVTKYTIDNVTEEQELEFEVIFGGSNSGFSATVDGKVLDDPKADVYNYGTSAKGKIKVKKGTKIELYVGYMLNTSLKIDGKNVKIDDSIVNSGGQYTLELTVAGDENESSK